MINVPFGPGWAWSVSGALDSPRSSSSRFVAPVSGPAGWSRAGWRYAVAPARACLGLAQGPIGESYVVAIINPANIPSRRVAEKLGMQVEQHVEYDGVPAVVYAATAAPA